MCGIGGVASISGQLLPAVPRVLAVMNKMQRHRGPDGEGTYVSKSHECGLAHRRLSIIDIEGGVQPMSHPSGLHIVFNGEIYNFIELRNEIGIEKFATTSDTEVIIQSYLKWGRLCVKRLRGMFAFAIWDERSKTFFAARDRIGIKPFYYYRKRDAFYFASEVKALLPFVDEINFDPSALKDYLTFQLSLGSKTLFKDISELEPGTLVEIKDGQFRTQKYWDVYYQTDNDSSENEFQEKLEYLIQESVKIHCRADVPIGSYASGGLDSTIVSTLAAQYSQSPIELFIGKFSFSQNYDESRYAQVVANSLGAKLFQKNIVAKDFIDNIEKVIYHLDYPVAGPGSFSQYMVSELVSENRKVVLGGQGGDEIFGGYVRYLLAYFEQCIRGAIDGTLMNGKFIVTYESIIPNLSVLQGYKPMIQEFWRDGLFGPMDERYFRLVNRAPSLDTEIRWDVLGDYSPYEGFSQIFNASNVGKTAYFDKMTHFDFKTLLPALLHVEDRMSMAHGIESRVPLLDHKIIEFAASVPANIKFKEGRLKRLLVDAMALHVPEEIKNRKDKMGFPTPITIWAKGEAKEFINDIFSSKACAERPFFNHANIKESLFKDTEFGRKLWGLLSLELWCQRFIDRGREFTSEMGE